MGAQLLQHHISIKVDRNLNIRGGFTKQTIATNLRLLIKSDAFETFLEVKISIIMFLSLSLLESKSQTHYYY